MLTEPLSRRNVWFCVTYQRSTNVCSVITKCRITNTIRRFGGTWMPSPEPNSFTLKMELNSSHFAVIHSTLICMSWVVGTVPVAFDIIFCFTIRYLRRFKDRACHTRPYCWPKSCRFPHIVYSCVSNDSYVTEQSPSDTALTVCSVSSAS